MIFDYANDKFPPAPVLDIQLSAPEESPQTEIISALVDTGSDFTLVPWRWLLQLDAPASRPAFVRGLWSTRREVTLYLVDIHCGDFVLPGVEVIGVQADQGAFEGEEVVLGRNVLNLFILLLEGPAHKTNLLERRPKRF
jgi:hypothetical protein